MTVSCLQHSTGQGHVGISVGSTPALFAVWGCSPHPRGSLSPRLVSFLAACPFSPPDELVGVFWASIPTTPFSWGSFPALLPWDFTSVKIFYHLPSIFHATQEDWEFCGQYLSPGDINLYSRHTLDHFSFISIIKKGSVNTILQVTWHMEVLSTFAVPCAGPCSIVYSCFLQLFSFVWGVCVHVCACAGA